MDVRSAAPLARVLIAVSAAQRDGELWLAQKARVVRLTLRRGRLYGIAGLPLTPLGDLLHELDELDAARARALGDRPGAAPIGVRLIAAGATSWTAVQTALALQRARAVAELLRMPVVRLWRTHEQAPLRGGAVAVDLGAAVWDALLAMAERMPDAARRQLAHGGQALALTARGEPGFASNRAVLEPTDVSPLRVVLCALGYAAPAGQREDAYALLLRKRRELARNVGPCALLDLPRGADAQGARRALRRLAVKLHPDRFQADDARLWQVSHEVISALTRAASSFVA